MSRGLPANHRPASARCRPTFRHRCPTTRGRLLACEDQAMEWASSASVCNNNTLVDLEAASAFQTAHYALLSLISYQYDCISSRPEWRTLRGQHPRCPLLHHLIISIGHVLLRAELITNGALPVFQIRISEWVHDQIQPCQLQYVLSSIPFTHSPSILLSQCSPIRLAHVRM